MANRIHRVTLLVTDTWEDGREEPLTHQQITKQINKIFNASDAEFEVDVEDIQTVLGDV